MRLRLPPSQAGVRLSGLVNKTITGCFYDDSRLVIVLDDVIGLIISGGRGGRPSMATEQGMALSVRVRERQNKLEQRVEELKQITALGETLT